MRRGVGSIAAACALLALAPESAGLVSFAGAPRLGLALLPWIALAGLPRVGRARRSAARDALGAVALAAPIVALAAEVDRRASGELAWPTALLGLCAIALSSAGAARGARAYGAAWLAVVVAPAALWTAFFASRATGARGGPAGLASALEATPLCWAARVAAGEHDPLARSLGAVALAGLLAAIGSLEGARARRAPAEGGG